MIRGVGPVWQALLGSLLTWGLTALGAAGVWVLQSSSALVLDTSLGFAAGVMTAASFWSLLEPALQLSDSAYGRLGWLPVAIGFALGAAFVHFADAFLPESGAHGQDSLADLPDRPADSSPLKREGLRQRKGEAKAAEKEEEGTPTFRMSWRRVLLLILAITVHNIPEGMAVREAHWLSRAQ